MAVAGMSRARDIRRLVSANPPQDVVPVLVEASRDQDRDVREASMFALDKLEVDTTEYLSVVWTTRTSGFGCVPPQAWVDTVIVEGSTCSARRWDPTITTLRFLPLRP
jgi:hypothetical protein